MIVNKRSSYQQSLLAVHGAVLLFALSALFGKWLSLPAIYIVFGRAFFAAVTLGIVALFLRSHYFVIDKKTRYALIGSGILLAVHWVSFFIAIQRSTVTLALLTFATFPLFVSWLEPLIFRERFQVISLLQALLTLVGIGLVLPLSALTEGDISGLVWGLLSAFSFAVLTIVNRKFVTKHAAISVAFYQNLFASICLIPFLLINPIMITASEFSILLLLGVVFTAFAHSLFNHSLKVIKAHTASIVVSLEPVYGIAAAWLLLGEVLTLKILVGGVIVLGVNIWTVKTQTNTQ